MAFGLTGRQEELLAHLKRQGPNRAIYLAAQLGRTQSSVEASLRRLERRGWVERRQVRPFVFWMYR